MHAVNPVPDDGGYKPYFDRVDPASTALVVVDLQNGFVREDGCLPISFARAIIPTVNRLIAAFRESGSLIVFLRHSWSDDPAIALKSERRLINFPVGPATQLRPGSFQHQIYDELDVRGGDLVVDKYRYSALIPNSSPLQDKLQEHGIDTLVICGAATNVCCESTARDAAMLDYRVFFLSDATACLSDQHHNASLLNMSTVFADVRDTASMLALLEAGARTGKSG